MRIPRTRIIAALFLLQLPLLATAGNDPVSGQWIGTYTVPDLGIAQEGYRIHLVLKGSEVKGTIGQGPDGFKLTSGVYDAATGRLAGEGETRGQGARSGETFGVVMEAVISGDTMTGAFVVGQEQGSFEGVRR